MTLPEMVFGGSTLNVSSASLGTRFSFNARDALQACGKQAGIQVLFAPLPRPQSRLAAPQRDMTILAGCR